MEQSERRKFPRLPKMIEIQYSSNSPPFQARITDMSEKGIFIDTINPLEEGAVVQFKFTLSDSPNDPPIKGEGKVVWNQYSIGMGIEFIQLNEKDRGKIRDFVKTQG